MSLLVDVDAKGRCILRPIVLKMIPELAGLSEEEALVLILVYDNFSPYRQLNERERIGRAILHVYSDNNPKLLEALENKDKDVYHPIAVAVRTYKQLQRNTKREQAEIYQNTIDELLSSIGPDLTDKEMEMKTKNIDTLRKYIKALEKEVLEELIDQGRLEGDKALSFLETVLADPKHYKAITAPKPGKK